MVMSRADSSPHRLSRTSVTAVVIAAIVFLAGAVNIYSAWVGGEPVRLKVLRAYHLLAVSHGTRTLTVMAGMLLIVLSWSIFRRKRQGWIAAVVLLAASLAFHLLKGLDYEEAIFIALVLGVLVGARHEFVVRSDRRSYSAAATLTLMTVAGSLLYGVLGFTLLQKHFTPAYTPARALQSTVAELTQVGDATLQPRKYQVKVHPPAERRRGRNGRGHRPPVVAPATPQYRTQTDFDAMWFADSLVGIAFISLLAIALALLRPVTASLHVLDFEREEVRRLLVEYGAPPLAYWALLPGLLYLFSPNRRAVIAYRVEENVALALGDPLGDPAEIPGLIATFDRLCLFNDWRPAWYQITERWLPVLGDCGWAAVKIGEAAKIDLPQLCFSGKDCQDIRTALNRLPREGCEAVWYNLVTDPEGWIPALTAISEEWMRAQHGEERGFSQGTWELALRYANELRMLVLIDADRKPIAFLTFVPIYGSEGGWALDLMRKQSVVCPGAMEFMLATALLRFKEEGATQVSLGLSALADITPQEGAGTPELLNRVRALVYEHFNRLYNFKGLHHFKDKFQPCWEARYLVYPSLPQLPRVLLALIRAHTVPSRRRPQKLPTADTSLAPPTVSDNTCNETPVAPR